MARIIGKVNCPTCGATTIQLPDEPTDDAIAKCHPNGHVLGRWGDIKAEFVRKAAEVARRIIRGSF